MTSTYLGEEEMLTVLETLALSEESLFVIDDRRRIVFWNQGMRRILARSSMTSCASCQPWRPFLIPKVG